MKLKSLLNEHLAIWGISNPKATGSLNKNLMEGDISEQNKHIENLSKLSSMQILAGVSATMSLKDFNILMKKIGKKLNVKGY